MAEFKAARGRKPRTKADRVTAHRQFTTLSGDPSGKANGRYKNTRPAVHAIAIEAILTQFAIDAKGVKVTKNGQVRRNAPRKGNALAGFLIHVYEKLCASGMSPQKALAQVIDPNSVAHWVDSGAVGRWAENWKANNVKVESCGTVERLRKDGPRKAAQAAQKSRWAEIGDAHRAKLEEIRKLGKLRGAAIAAAQAEIRRLGLKV